MVTLSVPGPWKAGRYRDAGASRSSRPSSTAHMTAVVSPTTLVSDARSYTVRWFGRVRMPSPRRPVPYT